jgi:uncharacterized membrane protein YbhN (UPF0104 family)
VNTLRRLVSSRAARLAGTLLGVGLIALLLVRLAHLWDDHPVPLGDANWPLLVLALALSGLAMIAYGAVWPLTLRALGTEPPPGLLVCFFAGQLGKYLPGGAWQYVGRAALARRLGVPLQPAASSLLLEAVCSLVAAALMASFVLADGAPGVALGVALLALGLAAFPFAARIPFVRRFVADLRSIRAVLWSYVAVFGLFGLAFWLTADALYDVPLSDFLVYSGAYAAAWAAGFVVVFAPGGLGVREAVLVALLRGRLGESEAIVLAATSRIAFTLVDLAGGGAALAALRRTRPAHREKARF